MRQERCVMDMKLNLTKKISLIIGSLIISVSLILGIVSVTLSSRALLQETQESMLLYAQESANLISTDISKNIAVLTEAARKTEMLTMNWEIQKTLLQEEAALLGYNDLAIVTKDGTAKFGISGKTEKISGEPYFQKALSGTPAISDVSISSASGEPVYIEAVPIMQQNTVIGVLLGLRDGNSLTAPLHMEDNDERYVFIIDSDSTIIAHPNKQMVLDRRNALEEIASGGELKNFGLALQDLGLGNAGMANYELNGDKRLTAIAPISDTGWSIGIGSYERVALAGITTLKSTFIIISIVIVLIGLLVAIFFSRRISKPIRNLKDLANQIALGDIEMDIETNLKDEVGDLVHAFGAMRDNIRLQAKAAEMIAAGDLSSDIRPRSDRDVIGRSMVSVIETLNRLAEETGHLTRSAVEGDLKKRGDAEQFQGVYQTIIQGVNQTLDTVIEPLNMASESMQRISRGDIPERITAEYRGDFNVIKDSLNTCMDAVEALIEDTTMLSSAAIEGKLQTRADAGRHGGDFGRIIEGINQTLDAVVGPIHTASAYIRQIGNGVIPERITETYHGDFNEIKNSINACIDGLGALTEGSDVLSKMSNNDYTSKVTGSYLGIYAEISDSINTVADRITHTVDIVQNISSGDFTDLEDLKAVGKRSENDALMPSMIQLIETIKALIDETAILSSSAIEGNLASRGDISKFRGEYAKVIAGINNTLNAVIEPVTEAIAVLKEMAGGNLHSTMSGDYRGDHAELKNAINTTIGNLQTYVSDISRVLAEIGEGNLSFTVTEDYKGDFIEIKTSLNNIITTLGQVMGNINDAAEQVSAGSVQVSDGSQSLSQGSTEQASAIEELTASMTEIAAKTKQNAVNAGEASQLAGEARDNAVRGNEQMQEMLGSMTEINESSANISKIIKVIDDIAFQTNILALNAAVEAARAGQHGKGFAVVAEEVRNLAARSAAAAKETTELIEGSIHKVRAGTEIANHTAAALTEIVAGIERSADLVAGIAKASNEQASGISQINMGIEQVSIVVQNNSATAEESAAASEELSGQAELLKQMVGRFRLSQGGSIARNPEHYYLSENNSGRETPHRDRPAQIILNSHESDKY